MVNRGTADKFHSVSPLELGRRFWFPVLPLVPAGFSSQLKSLIGPEASHSCQLLRWILQKYMDSQRQIGNKNLMTPIVNNNLTMDMLIWAFDTSAARMPPPAIFLTENPWLSGNKLWVTLVLPEFLIVSVILYNTSLLALGGEAAPPVDCFRCSSPKEWLEFLQVVL